MLALRPDLVREYVRILREMNATQDVLAIAARLTAWRLSRGFQEGPRPKIVYFNPSARLIANTRTTITTTGATSPK